MKERNRGWQDPYVERAFTAAKDSDVPPIITDALTRLCAKVQEQVAEENRAAVTRPKAKKKKSNGGTVALGVGGAVGGVKEVIDWIFVAGFGTDKTLMEFLALPAIDGGIVAILTASATWIVRKK